MTVQDEGKCLKIELQNKNVLNLKNGIVVYIHGGILHSYEKRWHLVVYRNYGMELKGYIKWNESEDRKNIWWFCSYAKHCKGLDKP